VTPCLERSCHELRQADARHLSPLVRL
jgi:hypothetical protein